MIRPALALAGALAIAACGGPPPPERLDCTPDPELLDPADRASPVSITVERKAGDLVWTDSNGIEHHITAEQSWMWHCRPHQEI